MNSLTEEEQADVRVVGRYLNHLANMSDRPEDDRSWYTQVMDDQLQALRLQREEALALRDRRSGSLRDRQNATRAPPDHYPIPGRTASRRTAPREVRRAPQVALPSPYRTPIRQCSVIPY